MLEPEDGKPSSPVLRGLGASNGARLLDMWDLLNSKLPIRPFLGTWLCPVESISAPTDAISEVCFSWHKGHSSQLCTTAKVR